MRRKVKAALLIPRMGAPEIRTEVDAVDEAGLAHSEVAEVARVLQVLGLGGLTTMTPPSTKTHGSD